MLSYFQFHFRPITESSQTSLIFVSLLKTIIRLHIIVKATNTKCIIACAHFIRYRGCLKQSFTILKTKPKIKRTMWSRRAQEYDQKINSGKIYELAEVVKDLNKNTDIIADQSYSERQLFEKAYEKLRKKNAILFHHMLHPVTSHPGGAVSSFHCHVC